MKYEELEREIIKYETLKARFKEFVKLTEEVKEDIVSDRYLDKIEYDYCRDDILMQKKHLISFKEEDYQIYAFAIFCRKYSSMADADIMEIIKLDEKKFQKIIRLDKEDSQFFSRIWKRPSVYIDELVRWKYVSELTLDDILKRIISHEAKEKSKTVK